ncbi:ribonuclease [Bacillus mangrovi]|uniref:Ribonuclease n=1 Tax=Metabacillus mangrovi TaxID=1491830 RepID=A0A7X2S114_9BACI|nr:YlzJ-like family protein [Metabacillus mangrovi]MTH51770.1 ribonuclease [Metabacillus mangrovi]
MILYTTMPHELIFEGTEKDAPKERMAVVNGVEMIVRPFDDATYEVVRVLSSNPNHYLQDDCMPGQKIRSGMLGF